MWVTRSAKANFDVWKVLQRINSAKSVSVWLFSSLSVAKRMSWRCQRNEAESDHLSKGFPADKQLFSTRCSSTDCCLNQFWNVVWNLNLLSLRPPTLNLFSFCLSNLHKLPTTWVGSTSGYYIIWRLSGTKLLLSFFFNGFIYLFILFTWIQILEIYFLYYYLNTIWVENESHWFNMIGWHRYH